MEDGSSMTLAPPFLAMMGLTFAVWVYMYARRIPFIRSLEIPMKQLTTPGELARLSPTAVNNPSENLKNLFELPVLFYAVVLYLELAGQADGMHLAAAWTFVGFRVLHSVVHCTVNHVPTRFVLYLVSSIALAVMVGRAALSVAFN